MTNLDIASLENLRSYDVSQCSFLSYETNALGSKLSPTDLTRDVEMSFSYLNVKML